MKTEKQVCEMLSNVELICETHSFRTADAGTQSAIIMQTETLRWVLGLPTGIDKAMSNALPNALRELRTTASTAGNE